MNVMIGSCPILAKSWSCSNRAFPSLNTANSTKGLLVVQPCRLLRTEPPLAPRNNRRGQQKYLIAHFFVAVQKTHKHKPLTQRTLIAAGKTASSLPVVTQKDSGCLVGVLPQVTFTVNWVGLVTAILFTCSPEIGFTIVRPCAKCVERPVTLMSTLEPAVKTLELSETM